MIEFLKRLLKKDGPTSEEILQEEDKHIYDKLNRLRKMALGKKFILDGSRHGTGKISCHHPDIVELNRTLKEVNRILESKVHLDEQLFTLKPLQEIYFETFLLTHKGTYLSDPSHELKETLRLIELYLQYMKGAQEATYGFMEYNHRRLYSFTNFLTNLLHVVIKDYSA